MYYKYVYNFSNSESFCLTPLALPPKAVSPSLLVYFYGNIIINIHSPTCCPSPMLLMDLAWELLVFISFVIIVIIIFFLFFFWSNLMISICLGKCLRPDAIRSGIVRTEIDIFLITHCCCLLFRKRKMRGWNFYLLIFRLKVLCLPAYHLSKSFNNYFILPKWCLFVCNHLIGNICLYALKCALKVLNEGK